MPVLSKKLILILNFILMWNFIVILQDQYGRLLWEQVQSARANHHLKVGKPRELSGPLYWFFKKVLNTKHVHFRGKRYIFIISYVLIVGWKINLVLLKFSFTEVIWASEGALATCLKANGANLSPQFRQISFENDGSGRWHLH